MVDVTGLVVAAFVLLSVLFGFLAFRLFKRPFNLTDTQLSFIDDEHQTDRMRRSRDSRKELGETIKCTH